MREGDIGLMGVGMGMIVVDVVICRCGGCWCICGQRGHKHGLYEQGQDRT